MGCASSRPPPATNSSVAPDSMTEKGNPSAAAAQQIEQTRNKGPEAPASGASESSFGHTVDATGFLYKDKDDAGQRKNFFAAVKQGNLSIVSEIVGENAAVVAAVGMWSSTPLTIACQYNHKDVALLLASKSDREVIDMPNEKGATALLYASLEPDMTPVLESLLSRGASICLTPANVYNGKLDKTMPLCPLSGAIINGNVAAARLILTHTSKGGSGKTSPIDAMTYRFPSPFGKGMLVVPGVVSAAAAVSNSANASASASASGGGSGTGGPKTPPKAANRRVPARSFSTAVGAKNLTPLMLACAYGRVAVVQSILSLLAMPKSTLVNRAVSMSDAASANVEGSVDDDTGVGAPQQHDEDEEFFLRDEHGCTVLHHICKSSCGDEKVVLQMLQLVRDGIMSLVRDKYKATCESSRMDSSTRRLLPDAMFFTLLSYMDVEGNSALHYACDNKFGEVVRFLISSTSSRPQSSEDAASPSHAGAAGTHPVLELGTAVLPTATVNSQNIYGITPLYIAVRKRSEACVKVLVDLGEANPLLQDRNNVSSADLAMKLRQDSAIYHLLEDVTIRWKEGGTGKTASSSPQRNTESAQETGNSTPIKVPASGSPKRGVFRENTLADAIATVAAARPSPVVQAQAVDISTSTPAVQVISIESHRGAEEQRSGSTSPVDGTRETRKGEKSLSHVAPAKVMRAKHDGELVIHNMDDDENVTGKQEDKPIGQSKSKKLLHLDSVNSAGGVGVPSDVLLQPVPPPGRSTSPRNNANNLMPAAGGAALRKSNSRKQLPPTLNLTMKSTDDLRISLGVAEGCTALFDQELSAVKSGAQTARVMSQSTEKGALIHKNNSDAASSMERTDM